MAGLKEKLPEYSAAALVGMVVPGLITLGIFATKADLEAFKAEVYREFMPRRETEGRLKSIDEKIDRMLDLLYSRKGKE